MTAITSHTGCFRLLSLQFGLVNAPASFKRARDIILSDLRWQTCLVYPDNLIVFSQTADEWRFREVLIGLEKAGVSVKTIK